MSPSFPPTWKFKTFYKRQRRRYVLSIADIIKNSSNVDDCLTKIKNISKRKIKTIERSTKFQQRKNFGFIIEKVLLQEH